MKWVFYLVGAIAVALISAFASVKLTTASLTDETAVYDDFVLTDAGWLYSDKIGAAGASGVERAKIALGGPLGLSAKEAVYFVATVDSEGNDLSSSCDYRISGSALETRWWSLTLYDTRTQHYVPNTINRSSWNSAMVPTDDQGNWEVLVSGAQKDGAWLPSHAEAAKTFELNLRIYNPSDALRAKIPDINVPVVGKVSC